MAGVMPNNKRSSGRKQWTIHGEGHRSSLKRLRNQLASEGCADSQVVLAKQLLEEEQSGEEIEKKENARLGVYWLIKASEQGNLEATQLLKQCIKTGKGITEQNYLDVKTCIDMTQDEKIARKAAREVFASLSNGEDYITSEQLQKLMLEVDRESEIQNKNIKKNRIEIEKDELEQSTIHNQEEEVTDWFQRLNSNIHNEKLTEDNIVAAAVDYSNGNLPHVLNNMLCLTEPDLQALDNIPFFQRSILHPFLAIRIVYYKIIRASCRKSIFNYLPILKSESQCLLFLFLYLLISNGSYRRSEDILSFFPMVVFYLSFVYMVLTTFEMVQWERDFTNYRIWSRLFLTYSGGSLNSSRAEFRFICNNLKPFGHFFIALLVNLSVHPLIISTKQQSQWLPYSELTIISFCLTFMTLFTFTLRKEVRERNVRLLLFLSFCINLLARYPYESDHVVNQGWRFLELNVPNIASYVVGNGVEFIINFRLLFYYLIIPFLLICLGRKDNWHGIYKYLMPHFVTICWLQMVIVYSPNSTIHGLLRGLLALVGTFLFLPLAGIAIGVILPAATLTNHLLTCNYFYNVAMFFSFSLIGLSLSYVLAKSVYYNKYTAFLQIFLGLIAFFLLVNSLVVHHEENDNSNRLLQSISWEQYQNFCYENDAVVAQMKCAKLNNIPIDWKGYVDRVVISEITNTPKIIIDKFPKYARDLLYCFFGDKIEYDCENVAQTLEEDCLNFYDAIKTTRPCHLDKYNEYAFTIDVKMISGMWTKSATISLHASNFFKNFTLYVQPEDKIRFKGEMLNVDENKKINVNLNEIECINCRNPSLIKFSEISEDNNNNNNPNNSNNIFTWFLSNVLTVGIKNLFNFILKPIRIN